MNPALTPFARRRIRRREFFLIGSALALSKSALDLFVLYAGTQLFGLQYPPDFNLLSRPMLLPFVLGAIKEEHYPLLAIHAATTLPFIAVGFVLVLWRLNDINAPRLLAALFFVPLVNYLFFAFLSLQQSKGGSSSAGFVRDGGSLGDRFIPRTSLGSGAAAVAVTTLVGLMLTLFSVEVLRNYGWGLFLGVPFIIGFLTVLIFSFHTKHSRAECVGAALASITLLALSLLISALEGIVCIAMAAPIAYTLAALGGLVGYEFQNSFYSRESAALHAAVMPLFLILLMALEPRPEAPLVSVTTEMEIDAPREIVWKNVVSFSDLPPPEEWIFRTGIAYPVRARISGAGPGAVRRCEFSTGAFVEPIEEWREPELLRFSVSESPPPLEEWNPLRRITPPHLDGFFRSRAGQFKLVALGPSRTRLEGTTWYQHEIWPRWYWQLFSDRAIGFIHRRVLSHIKRLSES
jgi:hypothetical protein